MPVRNIRRKSCARPIVWLTGIVLVVAAGCNPDLVLFILGARPQQGPELPTLAVTFANPVTTQNVAPGAPFTIQWADVAMVAGTTATLRVERVDPVSRETISEIPLTVEDALADGDADKFDWNVIGVIVGNYQPVITLAAPDGTNVTARATGDLVVTSALPVPTLSFTNPAAADVPVAVGNNVNLTWTDNGVANGDTVITLRLDPTPNAPASGDERTIATVNASDNGNNGTFNFTTVDSDAMQIAPGTYTLSATLNDGVHDDNGAPLRVTAVGRVVITP
ncbi:MAG: hypothetical protein U1A27_09140 [Phycisphaerae bacterium]